MESDSFLTQVWNWFVAVVIGGVGVVTSTGTLQVFIACLSITLMIINIIKGVPGAAKVIRAAFDWGKETDESSAAKE